MNVATCICELLWRQTWLSLRWKKSIYRHLQKHGNPPDGPFVADFFGLKWEGNLYNNVDFSVFYYGAFEKPLLYFMRDVAVNMRAEFDAPISFCDIGSNVGQHAVFMS